MKYPIKRDLDGVYFRVERDGKWENACFSDMTLDERNSVMEGRDEEWLKSMCNILADSLRFIGDELDITYEYDE